MSSGLPRSILVGLFAATCLSGCAKKSEERTWLVMYTFCSVAVTQSDASRVDEAETLVSEEMLRLQGIWNYFDPKSDVARMNASDRTPVAVSPETADLMRRSLGYSRISDGCFDATVGPLVDLWGIGSKREFVVPDDAAIKAALKECGWRNVSIEGRTVQFAKEGMHFDPGGIVKGLAVDLCCDLMSDAGLTDYMVNLGGNMRCFGVNAKGGAWRVGVRDPFEQTSMLGVLEMTKGMAVATSGNYERFVEKDGRRYAHIIDPRSGKPVEGVAGVTVIAPTAADADALSTAIFVAGIDEGLKMARRLNEVEFAFVKDIKPVELHVTKGFLDHFEPKDGLVVVVIGD
jgi:thiamine biosynthesis lipoprotein